MTYISRKTRLLTPRWLDECDPAYLYHLNRKRSDGRLKRHCSCDDLRAWVDDQYLNHQYFLELMTDGEFQERPFLGIMGRIIPVEDILDVLCGEALCDNEGHDKITGPAVAKLGPKPENLGESDVTVTVVTTDDILKITNAAMCKLENISSLMESDSDNESNRPCDEKNDLNLELSCDAPRSEEEISENVRNREEYLAEYNNVNRKISCLRLRLGTLQQRREELNAKFQSSRQAMCRASSGMSIAELYSREDQMHTKRLQKRIEKLIQERGQVLKEMCQALKYLEELKKKIDLGSEQWNYKRSCNAGKEYYKKLSECSSSFKRNDNGRKKERDESVTSFHQRKIRSVGNSNFNVDFLQKHSQDNSATKYQQYQTNDNETTCTSNATEDADSSEAVFTSAASVREPQRAYHVSEMTSDRRSKSEVVANDVEEVLRSYEQRLSELGCLEIQIEELKRKASMASYFKERWLRCTSRGRVQKLAERARMREQMKQLCAENNDLKKLVVKLTANSEKEQKEIQYLKFRHQQMSEMADEIMALKEGLHRYQKSSESQRECIRRLENTVTMQRDRIEKLMTDSCGVNERAKETGKVSKKCPRSRSYGPESKKTPRKTTKHVSSEESLLRSSCCYCCSCNEHSEEPNRPRSECGRIMSLVAQQTWRRYSGNN